MWPPLLATAVWIYLWVVYENAYTRTQECQETKLKIPTRQFDMDELIFKFQKRRSTLRVALVLQLVFMVGLWVHYGLEPF